MAYLRFLTDKDYCSIATEEHMKQLVRGVPERVPQAEQRAEMCFLEHLDQYYEIEKVLAVGKNIRDYSAAVTYPGGAWLKLDGEIYKTLRPVNGYKKPSRTKYWRHIVEFVDPCLVEGARRYSQLRTYSAGEVARFGGAEFWECLLPHGFEAGEVHVPGCEAWAEVPAPEWEPNLEWEEGAACAYGGRFYQRLAADGVPQDPDSPDAPPDESSLWGLIGDYSLELEYAWGEGSRDYVAADGAVFRAAMNPNADPLEDGVNIARDDPRHPGVVAHMSRIALYYLHQIVSPANISETRRWAYEDSMAWLHSAARFKINPQLPRKREREGGEPKVDWALATYQRSYDPNENAWLI